MPKNKELSTALLERPEVMGSRVAWLEHAGVRYLCLDFSAAPVEESLRLIDQFEAFVKEQPDNSILMLTDVSHAGYDSSISNKWKSRRLQYDVKIRASAIFGLSGLVGVAVKAFVEMTKLLGYGKRSPMVFKNRDLALAWLIKQ